MSSRQSPGCDPAPFASQSPALASPLTVTLTLCTPALASPRARASPPEGGWLRPQAEGALISAAREGDLATLKRLVEEGVNVNATGLVSAAPPARPQPPPPLALRPRRPPPPAAPPSPPPLTACGAAAAPPQGGNTALSGAAVMGRLGCLDHLIAKGANLNVQDNVRRGPAVAWRRGV